MHLLKLNGITPLISGNYDDLHDIFEFLTIFVGRYAEIGAVLHPARIIICNMRLCDNDHKLNIYSARSPSISVRDLYM